MQIDTLVVNPLKTSMKTVTQAVKTMPDNMLNTVDGVMDNISKLFGNPKKPNILLENAKVGAGLDTEVRLLCVDKYLVLVTFSAIT